MTTAVIVQARMSSTRLPGKVLLPLAGRSVLAHVLTRCQAIPGADVVVCATVGTPDCDPVAAEASRCGAEVFRGDESDVLGRYLAAADMVKADRVMRVTSDCPWIDPDICGAVLRLHADRRVDYACNNMPPSWPHGLDCEAFTTAALRQADRATSVAHDREHVTPYLRNRPEFSKMSLRGPGGWWAGLRWTLDTPQDYDFFQRVHALLPAGLPADAAVPGMAGLGAVLAAHPGLVGINGDASLHHGVNSEAPSAPFEAYLPGLAADLATLGGCGEA